MFTNGLDLARDLHHSFWKFMKNSPSRGVPLTRLVSTLLPSPFFTSIDSTEQTGYKKLPLWPSLHISAHSRSWDGKPRKFNLPSPAGAKEVQPEMETLPDNNWNYMGCLREVRGQPLRLRRPFHCPIIFSTELPNLGTNYSPHQKLVTQILARFT